MKLTGLYIAGFGNLQDFTYEFSEGVNVISAPNGWGKSTFAAFLRAMFYGLGDSRARSVAENARKRYSPWSGGSFGGSLEFEANGKHYRIERFFGAKESEDTFTLYALETGKQSEDFTENIGEEMFGIDADGFCRTVFMDASAHIHGKVEKNANNSINTKLNNLLQAENDLGSFEQAMDALIRRKRKYKTTGERGEIYAGERRLIELQRQIETCQAQKAQAQQLDEQIAPCGFANWNIPKGGYFVSLNTMHGTAKRALALCKEAGVVMTSAGATFPYGKDPQDSNIRIAPSLPPVEDLEQAIAVFCTCLKMAALEKLGV